MSIFLIPLLVVLIKAIGIFIWIIIIWTVLSLLLSFNIINYNNQLIKFIFDGLNRIIEPLSIKIRKIVPIAGGLDFSPLILILICYFLQMVLFNLIVALQ